MKYHAIPQNIDNMKGQYIRLGGHGIMDGLLCLPYKRQFYKIVKLDKGGLILRPYKGRSLKVLPFRNWGQACEIIPHLKGLPEYL